MAMPKPLFERAIVSHHVAKGHVQGAKLDALNDGIFRHGK